MKKNLLFLITLLILISCNTDKKFIGHWHEYIGNSKDFKKCIIINDSTFSIDKYTIGGEFDDYEDFNFILQYVYYGSLIFQNYKIKRDFILINDSTRWIKQKENTQTFINDLSAGLKIKINPIIDKFSEKDTIDYLKLGSQFYIGKLKDFAFKDGIKDQFNVQLNDKIKNDDSSLLHFLFIRNCHSQNYSHNYLIIADGEISKVYIDNIRRLMGTINIDDRDVYFRYADTTVFKYGYKNIKEIDEYLK